jgi:acyl-CoA synthetase (AMP-forming)/AMP-acid ligase II
VVPNVPRNPAGKILKHKLREQFAPAPEGSGR